MSDIQTVSLIEDKEVPLEHYADLISQDGRLEVRRHIVKDTTILNEVVESKPDLILVDYDLQTTSVFLGGGLASMLRERLPNIPIILISDPNILRERMPAVLDALGGVDHILYKDEMDRDPSGSITFIFEIIKGFAQLNAHSSGDINMIFNLMRARNPQETDLLEEAWQFQDTLSMVLGAEEHLRTELLARWSTPQVSRWILHVLFRFPGILYDELYAATSLGIDVASFLSSEVKSFLDGARYNGIFGGTKDLWWKNRLYELSYKLLKDTGFDPPLSRNFGEAFEKKLGTKIEPSRDAETNEQNADTVCYVLRMPFMRKNTLEATVDNRPPLMDQARVSFKAISEKGFNLDFLTSEGRRIVRSRR